MSHLITFMTYEGRAERALAEHQCDPNGLCTLCSTPNERRRWPCASHYAATQAAGLVFMKRAG